MNEQNMAEKDTGLEIPDVVVDTPDPVPPTEDPKPKDPTTTQIFAKRLKESTEKARAEERLNIAQLNGFTTWEEYQENISNSKLLDKGLDPDKVKPILKELIQNDPEYKEAIAIRKEKEKLEQELWAKTQLENLNKKFNTSFTKIDELDADTVDLWNKGVDLEKAYAAYNYDKISKAPPAKKEDGKTHLNNPTVQQPTGGERRKPTSEELRWFKVLNKGKSEEEYIKYMNKEK